MRKPRTKRERRKLQQRITVESIGKRVRKPQEQKSELDYMERDRRIR